MRTTTRCSSSTRTAGSGSCRRPRRSCWRSRRTAASARTDQAAASGGRAARAAPARGAIARRAVRARRWRRPVVVIDNAWGRFVLRAYALSDEPLAGDAPVAVRIQRQEPMLLKFVDALQGFGLSPQQREIAAGLARGASNQELADALGVSRQYHRVSHQAALCPARHARPAADGRQGAGQGAGSPS